MRLDKEMTKLIYDYQVQVTRCFSHILKGELSQARKFLVNPNEQGSHQRDEPLVLLA